MMQRLLISKVGGEGMPKITRSGTVEKDSWSLFINSKEKNTITGPKIIDS